MYKAIKNQSKSAVLFHGHITTHTDSIATLIPFCVNDYENMYNCCKQVLTPLFNSLSWASEMVRVCEAKATVDLSDIVD